MQPFTQTLGKMKWQVLAFGGLAVAQAAFDRLNTVYDVEIQEKKK